MVAPSSLSTSGARFGGGGGALGTAGGCGFDAAGSVGSARSGKRSTAPGVGFAPGTGGGEVLPVGLGGGGGGGGRVGPLRCALLSAIAVTGPLLAPTRPSEIDGTGPLLPPTGPL